MLRVLEAIDPVYIPPTTTGRNKTVAGAAASYIVVIQLQNEELFLLNDEQ